MDPFTPSLPILFAPSWGTALPLMTISLLEPDFYNISLWTTLYGENCIDAQRHGRLQPLKWNWQWIESSHWYRWRYSYPGTYCVIIAPFECEHCRTTLSGPFVVRKDTSNGGACCHHGKVRLSPIGVHKHRLEPFHKKSISLRLTLDGAGSSSRNHRCGTRFYVEFFNITSTLCNYQTTSADAQVLTADELILDKDFRLHNVPVNATHLCLKLTPRCDQCAFICPPSFHVITLKGITMTSLLDVTSNPHEIESESICYLKRHRILAKCATFWLVMTLASSAIIRVVNKHTRMNRQSTLLRFDRRPLRGGSFDHLPLIISRHSVLHMDHFD